MDINTLNFEDSLSRNLRILIKYGKLSKIKMQRYYHIKNKEIICYKNHDAKKISFKIPISNCLFEKCAFKYNLLRNCVKINIISKKK
jgi:hypothetical protein